MDPIQAFVEFYWSGADGAVREYVAGLIEGCVEEDMGQGGAEELAQTLAEFLEAGTDLAAFRPALPQLLAAVRSPGSHPAYPWLAALPPKVTESQAHHAPETSATSCGSAPPDGGRRADQATPPAATPLAARSGLNVVAAEFKQPAPFQWSPSDAAHAEHAAEAALATDLASVALGEPYGGLGLGEEWAVPEPHPSVAGWGSDVRVYNYAACNPVAAAAGAGTAGEWGITEAALPAGQASEDAFLAVLSQQFPEYSLPALRDLFGQCGRSLPATVETICCLEAELSGQMHAAHAAPAAPGGPPQPEFTPDDFPSLCGGGGTAAAAAPHHGAGSYAGSYAGRAGAVAPTASPAATLAARPVRPRPRCAGASGAPVWQSQGVHRFATGAAAAEEYAEARAAARDHARVRNALFQQATAAYLAGNKALAKELGRQGRQRNEAMKAAHAGAAAETFSRRNAASLSAAGAGGGVPTIDLHALHVSEALGQLEAVIERLQGAGARAVRVVVGVGQHGKTPARLPAAVRDALDAWGLRHRVLYAGLLEVTLS